jgi:DNA polymerase-3 subunit epsilon
MPSSQRTNAIKKARAYHALLPLFIDTETTGLSPFDEIVEIAIVDSDGAVLFNSLVRPTRQISPESGRVHKITQAMLADQPTWPELLPEVAAVIGGKYVGIYNADFDLRMIQQTQKNHGLAGQPFGKTFCIMKLYAEFSPFAAGRYQKLEDAGRQCRIAIPNSHRALDDAQLARAVFQCMVNS